jgi:UPF0755 protein
MIDELDVAFDEHAERGKPRHRRTRRDQGGGGGGRSGMAFLMAFVLLAVLGGGAWYGYDKVRGFFTAADYDGQGTDTVSVQIEKNASLTDIGNVLVAADVVKSTKAFIDAAEENPRGKNIRDGSYTMRKQMAAKDAVALLLDPASRDTSGVTIPEGKTAKDVYAILAKATKLPVKDFEAAGKDPEALGVPAFWFNRSDEQKVNKSIEGFLFPDTYELNPKGTAADDLKLMVTNFLTVTTQLDFVETVEKERNISPYEALTVASLAQAEAGNADDLGKIARVAYNRVYSGKFQCDCLEFDVGINYYRQLTGKPVLPSKKMTDELLYDPKNPYRTHGKPGLTPTPINNPGKAALQAAAKPATGNWLFFVAIDKQGHSAFASTVAEHDRNVAIARKNGIL